MGMKLITGPAVEPVSLAEAKTHLSINDDVQDAEITRNIVAARQYAENYIQGSLISQTHELALDAWSAEIELPRRPVQSIVSVKYLDPDGAEQTVSGSNYGLDNYSPRHWLLRGNNYEWPTTLDGSNVIKVQFTSGFGAASTDVPAQIIEAILLTVGHWVNFRPLAEQGISVQMVPRAVDHLLRPYKLWNV